MYVSYTPRAYRRRLGHPWMATLGGPAAVAQLVEHFTRNEGVSGSNPLGGSRRRVNRYGRVNRFVEVAAVYVRVVRFSDVSAERIEGLRARVDAADGPPPGIPTTGLKVLYDEGQGTAVVLQYFATAEDMEAGDQAFSAMDAAETPGTRASVDMCEIKLEVDAP
jgi:hypothetical protein